MAKVKETNKVDTIVKNHGKYEKTRKECQNKSSKCDNCDGEKAKEFKKVNKECKKPAKSGKVVRERQRQDALVARLESEVLEVIAKCKRLRAQADATFGLDRTLKKAAVSALAAYGSALMAVTQYEELRLRSKSGKPLHRTDKEVEAFNRFVGLCYNDCSEKTAKEDKKEG